MPKGSWLMYIPFSMHQIVPENYYKRVNLF